MFQATAFEECIEFLQDVCGQVFALVLKVFLETWPVFLNDLVEESLLGSVAFIIDRCRGTVSDVGSETPPFVDWLLVPSELRSLLGADATKSLG